MCSLIRGCAHCGADQPPLQCSRCRVAAYCGKTCQAADWSNHKVDCSGEDLTNDQSKFMTDVRHFANHKSAQLVVWALVHSADLAGNMLSGRLDGKKMTIGVEHIGKGLPTREYVLQLTGGPGNPVPLFSIKTKVIAAEARAAWEDLTQVINSKEITYPLVLQLGDKCEFKCGEDHIAI